MKIKYTTLLLVLIFCKWSFAEVLFLNNTQYENGFLPYAEIYTDRNGESLRLQPNEVLLLPFFPASELNTNDIHNTIYIKLSVKNEDIKKCERFFSFGYSNEEIIVYKIVNGEILESKTTGTDYSFDAKDVKAGRQEIVKIGFEPKEASTILIKITNKRAFAKQFFKYSLSSFTIYPESCFNFSFNRTKLFNSFYYGAILVMFFYTFMLFLTLRNKSYGFLSLFIFLCFCFNATTDGLTTETILSDYTYLDRLTRVLLAPAMVISYILFARYYLRIHRNNPKVDKVILLGSLMVLINYILFIRGYWWLGRNLLFVEISILILLLFVVSFQGISKKDVPTRYFVAANTLLLISVFGYILYLMDYIPHNKYTRLIAFGIQVTSLLEFAMFSLGLSYRVKNAESELKLLKDQNEQEKLKLIIEKNIELEKKVSERTKELALEKHEMTALNEQLEQKVRERTKKLQKAYRDLLNLNYELDSFIYRAAHDIRGPITTIMGLCNLALLEKDFNKCQEYLLILDKYSKTTQITLNRILGVNDLKNNPIKLSHFSLNDLEKSVMALLINNQDYLKVDIKFNLPYDDHLYSDQYLLQLILQNLIDNSIRFRNTNSDVKPYCNVDIIKESSEYIIRVSDNGEGIDDSIKDKIFDMFFRGSEYSSGSGLGLYIVKIAVKKLHGEVSFSSVEDQTTFEIKFPYQKDKSVKILSEMVLQTPIN